MSVEMLWTGLIQIQFLMLECIKLSFLGEVTESTTIIAESMFDRCDVDRNKYLTLDLLVAYHKDNKAISLTEQQASIRVRPVTHKTTAGWHISWQGKNGSTSWEKLSELKESHPVQMAEFHVVQWIDHEPAYNWWVQHELKKREKNASIRKQ